MNSSAQTRKAGDLPRLVAVLAAALAVYSAHAQVDSCGIARLPENAGPFYPPIARAAHVGGEIVLRTSFDYEGHVKVTRILDGTDMLKPAATKLIESSNASPSHESRECRILVTYEIVDAEYDNKCKVTNTTPESVTLINPQHLKVIDMGLGCCDPAITYTRHHFLFFHWSTKS